MPKIKILITGGTFDKVYDENKQVLMFGETQLPRVLKQGRNRLDVEVVTLMLKDSRELNDADREIVANYCKAATETKIVITHGTDTMDKTAEYLASRVPDKTIVITGAMIPYTFGSSDGLFNLGCALAFVQTLPTGVYVAMNGQCFAAGNVKKNLEGGFFSKVH
ncbi:asparaginase [Candidatus Micrarchaeota archaeon]|nr:asparaginase [Candidatus Micrarchaeota archaeon]